jgi:glycosyltransferase involved in cell wall biosynthesis
VDEPGACAKKISLVIPVYNSAGFIEENLRRAAEYMCRLPGPNEIVVVDDAGTDGTDRIIQKMIPDLTGISIILLRNETNFGKGYSVRRGIRVASGRQIIFNDADFTYPVEEVGRVSGLLSEGNDVVIACRLHPDSRYLISPSFFHYLYTRHLMSRGCNLIVNLALGLKIRDTQAGIKGFQREAAHRIFERQSLNRFSFDLEVLTIARRLGLSVHEMPVQFLYRKEPSTIRFSKDSLHMLYDIMRIKWRSMTGKYK